LESRKSTARGYAREEAKDEDESEDDDKKITRNVMSLDESAMMRRMPLMDSS